MIKLNIKIKYIKVSIAVLTNYITTNQVYIIGRYIQTTLKLNCTYCQIYSKNKLMMKCSKIFKGKFLRIKKKTNKINKTNQLEEEKTTINGKRKKSRNERLRTSKRTIINH